MPSSTDSTLEETLGNGIIIKKENPSLQESVVQLCCQPTIRYHFRGSVIITVCLPANFTAVSTIKHVKGLLLVVFEPSNSLDSLWKIAEFLIEV